MSTQTTNANAGGTSEQPQPESAVFFLMAETPVHAGAAGGQGALDLPIQRSVQTKWPILNDSTVRGGLRRLAPEADAKKWFGDENSPGRFSTPDAEVLLFPVASAKGLSAWVTCIEALQHFERRLRLFPLGTASQAFEAFQTYLQAAGAGPGPLEAWTNGDTVALDNNVVLEADRYTIPDGKATGAGCLADWFQTYAIPFEGYWATRVLQHLVLIPEPAFTHYVQRKTDIRTRIKVDGGKAAKSGPWTEENLPIDTVLFSVLYSPGTNGNDGLQNFRGHLKKTKGDYRVLQLGGDQSLGRGMMRLRVLGE